MWKTNRFAPRDVVGISSEYFEDMERFKQNAATAMAQCIHNNLRDKVSE
jgi:hypothetical protein